MPVLVGWSPGNSAAVFLPVGGKLTAVRKHRAGRAVDHPGSRCHRLRPSVLRGTRPSWSRYRPRRDPAGYYGSIANCVNATQQIWEEITQSRQPPPSLYDPGRRLSACQCCAELTNKTNAYLLAGPSADESPRGTLVARTSSIHRVVGNTKRVMVTYRARSVRTPSSDTLVSRTAIGSRARRNPRSLSRWTCHGLVSTARQPVRTGRRGRPSRPCRRGSCRRSSSTGRRAAGPAR